MRQTPHLANTSRAGGEFGEESDAFLKQLAPLKTVIELSEHSNDQVPQGRRVPVAVFVAAPTVVALARVIRSERRRPRGSRRG